MSGPAPPREEGASLRVVIRLDFGDRGRIGPGKIGLLEVIAATGSIAGAARLMRMSYPRALSLVAQIEATLRGPVVNRASGGAHGGGATLTERGKAIISRYRAIEAIAQRGADTL